MLPVLVAVGAVLLAVRRIFARRPFNVTANGEGLRWRRWARRRLVPWHDVRTFAQITLEPPEGASDTSPPRMLYWAAGAHDRLVWMSSPPTRRRGAQVTADQRDVAWRLCGIVAARSGRPLRDLSESTAQIVDPEPNGRLDRPWQGISDARGVVSATELSRVVAGRRGKLAFYSQLALVAALLLAGLGVLKYQPRVYAARLAQAESAPPLLSASMTTPLVGWPVGRTLQGQFAFTSSGYELTSEQEYCCDVFGWGPTEYADATVEVTVHQATDFDLSEAGLVVRTDDASPSFLVFAVTPKGDWRLEWLRQSSDGDHVPETLMWDGVIVPVGAVHRGNDAINRLAVIMRGGSYVLYINGQVVGTYQGGGPVAGHVGVYSDGLSQSAIFTNFAIYPDPPPSLFYSA